MIMEDIIVLLILIAVVVLVLVYLYRAKKKGQKCIGCPYCNQCGGKCNDKK